MNNLSVENMLELARVHEHRAKVLWARHDRTLSREARARIALQANAEQNAAVAYTMKVRNLRPQPIKVTA